MGNRSILALGILAAAAVAAALLLPSRAQPDLLPAPVHSEETFEADAEPRAAEDALQNPRAGSQAQNAPPPELVPAAKETPATSVAPAVSTPSAPKLDAYGDPLPPGAVARLGSLRYRYSQLNDLAYSPNGKLLALAGSGLTSLMDVKTGATLMQIGGESDFVQGVAISRDGRRLAQVTSRHLSVWDLESGKMVWRIFPKGANLTTLAFSNKSSLLAISGRGENGGLVDLHEVATGKIFRTIDLGEQDFWAIAWSPDDRTIAVAGQSTIIYLINPMTGHRAGELRGHTLRVFGLAFSPDGSRLVSTPSVVPSDTDLNDSIRLWDPRAMTQTKTIPCHPVFIRTPAYSPDGRHLVWLEPSKRRIQLWDLEHDRLVRSIPDVLPNDRIRFAPDGSALAVGGGTNEVRLIDPWTGKRLNPPSGPDSSVDALALSPDGTRIATTDWSNGSAQIWETATGKPLLRLPPREAVGHKAAWSPDGKLVAVATSDRDGKQHRVRIWNAATGKALRDWTPHEVPLSGLCFTSNGTHLVTAGWSSMAGEEQRDLPIRVWDVATGKEIRRLEGHTRPAARFALSPDNRRLAAFSFDDALRIWDLDSGKITHEIKEENMSVKDVLFLPDSNTLVYQQQSLEPGPHVWNVATGQNKWYRRGDDDVGTEPIGIRPVRGLGLLECLSTSNELRLVNFETKHRCFAMPAIGTYEIYFTPDGRFAITQMLNGTALVWDLSQFLRDAAKDERPDF